MLKFKKTCATCMAVKDNKRLLNEIFNSKFYMKTRGESLQKLADRYTDLFSYQSLKNHVRNHQYLSEADFTNRHLDKIAREAEQNIVKRTIESKEVFDEIIGQGMEDLQAGKMEIRTKDLLNAAKFKKDFELKEKDQQFALMDMVFHFASGENNLNESNKYDRRFVEGEAVTNYDPAEESAADSERRKDESSSFYQSLAGDAPPPRTD